MQLKQCLAVLISYTVIFSPAALALEEVLVTSQKREQRLTEVPFSVGAISASTLEQLNITQLSQLQALVPGLYITDNESSRPTYTIRGLSSGEPSAHAAARIAIYLNDADISRNRSSHIELHDLARIEVIKGPQSTLFGTTASAGAIAYYTQKASAETYSKLRLSMGNFDHFEVQAVANGGNEHVAARLALLSRDRDGYIDNSLAPGQALGGLDRLSIRPSLHWNINANWQADLVLTYERGDDTVSASKSGLIAPPNGTTNPFSTAAISGSSIRSPLVARNELSIERRTQDANLQLQGNSGPWSITSLSAYREYESSTPFDADGSQAEAFELLEQASGQQFSQELRALYQRDRLSINTAVSYMHEGNQRSNTFSADEGSYLMCVPLARQELAPLFRQFAAFSSRIAALAAAIDPNTGLPCTNADGSVNSLTPLATRGALTQLPYAAAIEDFSDHSNYSLLLDLGYDLSDAWHIDAGIRYLYEQRDGSYRAVSPPAVLLQNLLPLLTTLGDTAGQTINHSSDDSDVLLRLNASYQWRDNHFAYASYSEGRRSEVIEIASSLDSNRQTLINRDILPAEKLENYELGLKGQTATVNYSAAIYYQRYRDFQVGFLDNTGNFRVANAGDTNNPGAELSLNWQTNDKLQLFGHINLFDHTLDNNVGNGIFGGKALENSSETTATLGFEFSQPIASHTLKVNMYGHYRSEFLTDPLRQPLEPLSGLALRQGGFTLINGSITLTNKRGHALTLWADNLTDKAYLANISDTGANLGMPSYQAAAPRTWGLSVSIEL